jgi:hypothetical protein
MIDADLRLSGRNDEMLEQIIARLTLEESVSAVSWQRFGCVGRTFRERTRCCCGGNLTAVTVKPYSNGTPFTPGDR